MMYNNLMKLTNMYISKQHFVHIQDIVVSLDGLSIWAV